jgi:hypothetical protein
MIHFILYENETNINAIEKNNRAFFCFLITLLFLKKLKNKTNIVIKKVKRQFRSIIFFCLRKF